MSEQLDKLKSAVAAAKAEVARIEEEHGQALSAARKRVEAQFADRLKEAREVHRAASSAEVEYISDNASHPWEGKRVFKMEERGNVWRSRKERVEGIVEVRRRGTQFPANMNWGLPELGQPFVRSLKKDGSPALKFHRWGLEGWRLVDGEGDAS